MQQKVLVIEDDFNSGQMLLWSMEALGHDARLALDGKSALAEIEKFVPDVVLCDIKLPDISGYEICRSMKKDNRLKHTLFVAQTGLDSRSDKQLSFEAGFSHHLVKPIDINQLFELVYFERELHRNYKRQS